MSAKDIFHNTVRSALEKDGWTITHDPLFLQPSQRAKMKIDLGAEKLLSALKGNRRIAVEVKSFVGLSTISEFHTAVGQFLNYRIALEKLEPERVLYLAVPADVYRNFFTDSFIQEVIERLQIKLLVFVVEKEEIALWTD
ncbi:MAG: fatty-acid oxidation protein subunit alpha [Oscillatoriales cyanobacterium]|uniref:XisH family protein n=1 Tax=Microcoleus anatoxicus PTRS2 TaxID=2705321 RepID=A0ABU8YS93_9CYAN|nr:MAG: fatty-acid oxidation protein subunit alpha [Oscillatoriales cyanobacterium]TAH23069.1 MAG: fatty-acid oxidation protein subunit alpha [Oscillatoriales cyanobacterium]